MDLKTDEDIALFKKVKFFHEEIGYPMSDDDIITLINESPSMKHALKRLFTGNKGEAFKNSFMNDKKGL